jgi:5-methylcytosine-specific restriction protein A
VVKRNNYGRIQGRAGVELRKRRLAREPLCRDCKAKGNYTEALTIDHIVPLALGGLDIDSNCRALCHPCHDRRTAEQFSMRYRPETSLDGWPVEG